MRLAPAPIPGLLIADGYRDATRLSGGTVEMVQSLMLCVLALSMAGTCVSAQTMFSGPRDPHGAKDSRYQYLIERLEPLIPEFKADLGFTIMDLSKKTLSYGQTKMLLESIFRDATKAHYAYSVMEAAGDGAVGLATDVTLSHSTASLLKQSKLDALDIQTGVIKRVLPDSPQLARRLFEQITVKRDRATCKNANVEDVSTYYETASMLAHDKRIENLFGQDKKDALLTIISSIRLPTEIAPAARLISENFAEIDDVSQAEAGFVAALDRITASDREMTAAEQHGELSKGIETLLDKLSHSAIFSGRVVEAYRRFLLRSLTTENCRDYSLDRTEVAASFNSLSYGIPSENQPLSKVDLLARALGDPAESKVIHFDPQTMTELSRIWIKKRDAIVASESKGAINGASPEEPDVDDILNHSLSRELAESSCAICTFRAEGAVLQHLIDTLPVGSAFEKVVVTQLAFLSFSKMQTEDPVAWLHFVKELINAGRKLDTEGEMSSQSLAGIPMPGALPAADSSNIRFALQSEQDPCIAAYVIANRLLKMTHQLPGQAP